jgi:hypothetical protein
MTGAGAIDLEFGLKLGLNGFEEIAVIPFECP